MEFNNGKLSHIKTNALLSLFYFQYLNLILPIYLFNLELNMFSYKTKLISLPNYYELLIIMDNKLFKKNKIKLKGKGN